MIALLLLLSCSSPPPASEVEEAPVEHAHLLRVGVGPRIRGRRLFKLSLRGFEPIDVEYDRARGASLVTYRPYRPEPASADAAPLLHRDVAELTDEEWRALEERRRTARTPPR